MRKENIIRMYKPKQENIEKLDRYVEKLRQQGIHIDDPEESK